MSSLIPLMDKIYCPGIITKPRNLSFTSIIVLSVYSLNSCVLLKIIFKSLSRHFKSPMNHRESDIVTYCGVCMIILELLWIPWASFLDTARAFLRDGSKSCTKRCKIGGLDLFKGKFNFDLPRGDGDVAPMYR